MKLVFKTHGNEKQLCPFKIEGLQHNICKKTTEIYLL